MTFSCMIKDGNIGKSLVNLRNYDVVLFDLDGTIAETEAIGHLPAFNCAFSRHDMDWVWSGDQYKDLLKVAGGFERLKAHRAVLESSGKTKQHYNDAFLKQVHQTKNEIYARLIDTGIVQPRAGFFELIKKYGISIVSGGLSQPPANQTGTVYGKLRLRVALICIQRSSFVAKK